MEAIGSMPRTVPAKERQRAVPNEQSNFMNERSFAFHYCPDGFIRLILSMIER
ncbi:hypothetical protein JMF97_02090 [Micromonospora fiedleri]|uniref:Uncharacterized protein n=1 Tax=Micromonospora fiedleri TaxID=1157498 RepID=A0ABS1UF56_9ACTN|nr:MULTISPECIES: hypothetical protein [Micromonospora]MBL6274950.1 hypothetical protein [Micromonospora fiedleri]WSK44365.1 hypothetical protein OG712_09650 [Micromonospora maris]